MATRMTTRARARVTLRTASYEAIASDARSAPRKARDDDAQPEAPLPYDTFFEATLRRECAHHAPFSRVAASYKRIVGENRGKHAHVVFMDTYDTAQHPVMPMHSACVAHCDVQPNTALHVVSKVRCVDGRVCGDALRRAQPDPHSTDMRTGVWQQDSSGVQWGFAYVVREANASSYRARKSREWRVCMPMLEDLGTPEYAATGRVRMVHGKMRYGTALRAALAADHLQRTHATDTAYTNFANPGEQQVVHMHMCNRPTVLAHWTVRTSPSHWRVPRRRVSSPAPRDTHQLHVAPDCTPVLPAPVLSAPVAPDACVSTAALAVDNVRAAAALAVDNVRVAAALAVDNVRVAHSSTPTAPKVAGAVHTTHECVGNAALCEAFKDARSTDSSTPRTPSICDGDATLYDGTYCDKPMLPFHDDAPYYL